MKRRALLSVLGVVFSCITLRADPINAVRIFLQSFLGPSAYVPAMSDDRVMNRVHNIRAFYGSDQFGKWWAQFAPGFDPPA